MNAHPFADLLNLHTTPCEPGRSELSVALLPQHMNPHGVAHGAVYFALADTGMGAALYPSLAAGQICATIEIKINYFKAVTGGDLVCRTEVINRGKTVANLESRVWQGDVLVAQANGNYAIFSPRAPQAA